MLCKKCEDSKNYWTEHHFIKGEKVGVCKHKITELNLESIGNKLRKVEKKRKSEELTPEELIQLVSLLYRFQLMVEGDDIYNDPEAIGKVVKILDNYMK